MTDTKRSPESHDKLLKEIENLETENEFLRKQNEILQDTVDALEYELSSYRLYGPVNDEL